MEKKRRRYPDDSKNRTNGDIYDWRESDPTAYIGSVALADETEQTAAGVNNCLSGHDLWDTTSAALEAAIDYGVGDSNTGHQFTAFEWQSDRYGPIELAIDRPDPAHAIEVADKGTFVGTLFYTSTTETGKSVLAYSMFQGPNGKSVERQTAEFDHNFNTNRLSSEFIGQAQYMGNAHHFESPVGVPALTNYEVMAAAGQFGAVANGDAMSSGEYGAGDAAGYDGGGNRGGSE